MRLAKNTRTSTKMKNWNKFTFLLFSFLLSPTLFAQDFYPLHPSVGDTINRIEKLDYSLFSNVSNQNFEYGLIKFINEGFVLVTYYNEQTIEYPLSRNELIEAQQNIEKINAYYRRKAFDDSIKVVESKDRNRPTGQTPVYVQGPMNEQAKKEARMFRRIETDRRIFNEYQRGLRDNPILIDFSR